MPAVAQALEVSFAGARKTEWLPSAEAPWKFGTYHSALISLGPNPGGSTGVNSS